VKSTINNSEAEQSVLGALMVRPDFVDQVAETLTSQDFYREAHSLIFRPILDIHRAGEPIDLVTVTQKLKAKKQLDKSGWPVFLAGLSEQVGFATNVLSYAKNVKEIALKRQLTYKLDN